MIAEIIGGSLTAVTVATKAELELATPSVTLKVRFEVPFAFATGVITALQFGAVPLNTTFATGINAILVEVIVTDVVQLTAVSTSEIVNAIEVNDVSSLVV